MTTAWQQKCTGNSPCPKGYGLFFAPARKRKPLPSVARCATRMLKRAFDWLPEGGLFNALKRQLSPVDVTIGPALRPGERPLLPGKARELGTPTLGKHSDVHRRMKARAGRNGALARRFHQTEAAQVLENARAPGPWDLTILDTPESLEYRFVRIHGHLDPFFIQIRI